MAAHRDGISEIVGRSVAMRAACEKLLQIAEADDAVLLRGEPGTGKTLAARSIHARSCRRGKPFVRLQCAAMPETAFDAALLAGSGGALTSSPLGAHIARADGGTLFLDEITDLGPMAQACLLGVVRDGVLECGSATSRTNVRVIAWSSRPLEEAVAAGGFRGDFFECLSTVSLSLPPLRDRKADLPGLLKLLVQRFASEHGRPVDRLSKRANEIVMNYDWPGNVRELSDAIERAVVVASGPVIHHHHLPPAVQDAGPDGSAAAVGLIEAIDAYERELLQDALTRAHGVRSRAARLLRTTDRIFNYKLRKHGIDSRMFKESG